MLAFKEQVYNATLELIKRQHVLQAWGNISAIDRVAGVMVIKPHKTNINDIRPGDMVVMDLNGNVLDGLKKPSLDAQTHLIIYNRFPEIGAIAHSHSMYASCWAQAGKSIPPIGMTHIDRFDHEIPCTRELTDTEAEQNYEEATGNVIVEALQGLDPIKNPAVLVFRHAPFVWGGDLNTALQNASLLEEIARMAYITMNINPQLKVMTDKQINLYHERYSNK